ncbi:hypothetical protein ACNKHM_09735 [Shigella sonnei]
MQAPEYGEHATGPAQDEEFVLARRRQRRPSAGFVLTSNSRMTSISRRNWSYSTSATGAEPW